ERPGRHPPCAERTPPGSPQQVEARLGGPGGPAGVEGRASREIREDDHLHHGHPNIRRGGLTERGSASAGSCEKKSARITPTEWLKKGLAVGAARCRGRGFCGGKGRANRG